MTLREDAVAALFNVLKQSADFKVASRRNQNPEGLDPATQTPALFLLESNDHWDRTGGYNQLSKREMRLLAIIYTAIPASDVNSIPSTFINNTIDEIETLFAPDNQMTDTFTLGGLVQACLLDGKGQRSPGDITGRGLAVLPIRILFP